VGTPRARPRATLPRAPAFRARQYRELHPLGELASWPAAVARAMDEAKSSIPARSRGVLALVLVLMEACIRSRSGRCSLTRKAIADRLGYRGRWADESVRKLLNRAWELGEVMAFDGQGFRAAGARGVTSAALVPVRLLQYLGALPQVLRARALADPLIVKALQAREDALRRELGDSPAPRPPPVLYGREGLPGPEFLDKQATGPGKASSSLLCSGVVPDLPPEMGPPASPRGEDAPAAPSPDGATGPGASSAGAGEAPSTPGGAEAPAPVAPHRGALATGPARERGSGGIDDEGSLDPDRLRVELGRLRALLAEVRDEYRALACGRTVAGVPLPPPATSPREAERRGAAELAAMREREREIRRLERSSERAAQAARVAWRKHKAAEAAGGDMLHTETPSDRARRVADYDAQQGPETPTAWCVIWSLLLERDDTGRRLAPLARCRARVEGHDLVLDAPDPFVAELVRDVFAELVDEAARRAGWPGLVRVEVRA
jgi:hypothetical protein